MRPNSETAADTIVGQAMGKTQADVVGRVVLLVVAGEHKTRRLEHADSGKIARLDGGAERAATTGPRRLDRRPRQANAEIAAPGTRAHREHPERVNTARLVGYDKGESVDDAKNLGNDQEACSGCGGSAVPPHSGSRRVIVRGSRTCTKPTIGTLAWTLDWSCQTYSVSYDTSIAQQAAQSAAVPGRRTTRAPESRARGRRNVVNSGCGGRPA